jgi:hypothetical protein
MLADAEGEILESLKPSKGSTGESLSLSGTCRLLLVSGSAAAMGWWWLEEDGEDGRRVGEESRYDRRMAGGDECEEEGEEIEREW